MKILFIYWNSCFCCNDMLEAMADYIEDGGDLEVKVFETVDPDTWGEAADETDKLNQLIKQYHPDFVYSFNFFTNIADICEACHTRYVSWVFDNPLASLKSPQTLNPNNYIFVFDSQMCDEMVREGVPNVFYLPMAVNPKRLAKEVAANPKDQRYDADVSFVGSLYNGKLSLYDSMELELDDYCKGYLRGLIDMQLKVYGSDIITPSLTEDVIGRLNHHYPIPLREGWRETAPYLYTDFIIDRKITSLERQQIICSIPANLNAKIYTDDLDFHSENATNMGMIDYFHGMPQVFHQSKINLNITLRSIRKGIPLRIFDIMGCGGFLLTNYQEDLFSFFEPAVDFVYWEDAGQVPEYIHYYLEHDDERRQIVKNVYEKVKKEHTFERRLNAILKVMSE